MFRQVIASSKYGGNLFAIWYPSDATPIWCRLARQEERRLISLARARLGSKTATSREMIPTTTRISMSVKPRRMRILREIDQRAIIPRKASHCKGYTEPSSLIYAKGQLVTEE